MSSPAPPTAVEETTRVLYMIVAMHVIGFVFKKLELLGQSAEAGLSAYCYAIGLPALLFTNVATLHFDNVDARVVFSILSAKLLLTGLSFALGCVLTRRGDGSGAMWEGGRESAATLGQGCREGREAQSIPRKSSCELAST